VSGLQWFRLYHRIVDDEKLRLLAFEDRWHFVALCCLKADGLLDTPNDNLRSRKIAVKLGVQLRELDEIGRRLQEVNLVDENLSPVAWDELQYKSDNSTNRVKKYREKQQYNAMKRERNVSVTGQETDTDTDTEVNTNVLTAKRRSVSAAKPDGFCDQLWKDWKNHRKAAFTETALKGIEREAAKAGWTLEAAITEAIERGWQGFKSDWVEGKKNGTANRTTNQRGNQNGFAAALRYVADGRTDEPF
jgi:ribosomal protein S13